MSETLGQQLAAAREGRGLCIEDVAHRTRIHHEVLRQLEAGDYTKLPNRMFLKSFLGIYCRFLEMEVPEAAIDEQVASMPSHRPQFLLGALSPNIREKYGHLNLNFAVRPVLASAAVIAILTVAGAYLVSHLYGANSPFSPNEPEANPLEFVAPVDTGTADPSLPGDLPSDASPVMTPQDESLAEPGIGPDFDLEEIPKAIVNRPEEPAGAVEGVGATPALTGVGTQEAADARADSNAADVDVDPDAEPEEEFLDPGVIADE